MEFLFACLLALTLIVWDLIYTGSGKKGEGNEQIEIKRMLKNKGSKEE